MSGYISINISAVETHRKNLQRLAKETVSITDPLNDSKGSATACEKEIIELLSSLCKNELTALINNSEQLLGSVVSNFSQADQKSKV